MPASSVDHIGDRLDHPEHVAPEFRHLIPDDRARVALLLTLPIRGRVLDVGCSDGAITQRLGALPAVSSVLGIDIWDRADRRRPLEFLQRDIRSPLGLSPVDTIVATEVFEHLTWDEAVIALNNLRAVLAPGGTMVIMVPNREVSDTYTVGCRDRWRWPDHRSWWTKPWVRRLVRPARVTWYYLDELDRLGGGIWLIATATWR